MSATDRPPDHAGEMSRRTFLGTAGTGAAFLGLAASSEKPTVSAAQTPGVRIGIASYSLRNFTRAQAIEMVRALGTPYVNIKSVHLAYDANSTEIDTARREFTDAGLQIVGGGTITFDEDTDAGVNRYFEYAKAAGMPLIVATCPPATLARVEQHAIRYDIKVAIHNHGPEDPHYPAPSDALAHVRSMDARMGLCIDVGHTVRTGADVVAAIADAGARLLDLHLKDLRDLRDAASQCVVGEGAIPIGDVLRQLASMRFAGCASLEYEIDAANPLPGMQRSMAYLRGVLSGLAASAKSD